MPWPKAWRAPTVILVCGLILMLALGTRQSFGLFLRPMTLDLGFGREIFSFAIALQNLAWGLGMPLAGAIADRYCGGRVLAFGGLAYGLGLVAMARSATPLDLGIAAGLLIGVGLACTGFGVVLAVVSLAILSHQLGGFAGAARPATVPGLTSQLLPPFTFGTCRTSAAWEWPQHTRSQSPVHAMA